MESSFLEGKSVLITGVTGFVGKAVLETLLRDHHNHIATVFCLVRPNKNQSAQERLCQVLNNKLFDILRNKVGHKEFNKIANRVVAIEGDIAMPGLGVSEADARLLHTTLNLAIHSAATVNFNMPIKDALQINTLGTMELLKLCAGGAHFQGFLHISTAYVNSNLNPGNVEEKLYVMPLGDPETLVDDIQAMTQSQVTHFTKRILQEYPNTYTFTKALTEHLLNKSSVSTACARLSIVASAAQAPVAGWVEGSAGLNAAGILIGQGILDSLNAPADSSPDIVPVDYAANSIMRICAQLLESPHKQVYHIGSTAINPMKWNVFAAAAPKAWRRLPPLKSQLFPPDCQLVASSADHKERVNATKYFKFHTLPTIIDSTNTALLSQLQRAEKKLDKFYLNYDYFTSTSWRFDSSNLLALETSQSKRRDILSSSFGATALKSLDWTKYITEFICGLHYFVLKDSTSWPIAIHSLPLKTPSPPSAKL
ncbi:hypothetical protein DSO57_1026797 [Entomophthora muscae]|uniref:Uncharacterized protein n=1 Tax=Entomophthora muscae TaxID=34485 RepID=A0ACC2SQU0_9FUNG|nr:hypothetical protein DSO57_1026797 [Entomophthora muscae]